MYNSIFNILISDRINFAVCGPSSLIKISFNFPPKKRQELIHSLKCRNHANTLTFIKTFIWFTCFINEY